MKVEITTNEKSFQQGKKTLNKIVEQVRKARNIRSLLGLDVNTQNDFEDFVNSIYKARKVGARKTTAKKK